MKKRTLIIAGKNNIAVDILDYAVTKFGNRYDYVVVCNKTETGEHGWQKSLRLYAQEKNITECKLEDVYSFSNAVFLSLEFDKIITPKEFRTKELYNIHFSLLPKYKGMYTSALPILYGEEYSGVTLHHIDAGIDTGDIIDQIKFKLDNKETAESLYLKYISNGIDLVKRNLINLLETPDNICGMPQSASASSYYSKNVIDYSNLKINLNQTAVNIDRQIRAFSFRIYQMPIIFERKIISTYITNQKSLYKPGTILMENELGCIVSTIDYNICLYFDLFDEYIDACKTGDLQTLVKLNSVVDYNKCRTIDGRTPLIVAAYHNKVHIVEYLIMIGADIFDKDYDGIGLFMCAKEVEQRYSDRRLLDLYTKMEVH